MSDTGEETFAELVSRAVDDAKEVARAEIALVRAQAAARVARYRTVALLLAIAALLGAAAIVVGSVGTVMILAPLIGIGWAVLAVLAALLAGAAILARIALGLFKKKWVTQTTQRLQ